MSAEPAREARERPGCVLGIALGILVLGSLAAWVCMPRGERRDGAALLAAWFAAPPAGYAIEDAAKLMGGEEVVRLVRDGAAAERAVQPPAREERGPQRVDWTKVEQGAPGQPPRSLIFVKYPQSRAQAELNRQFSERLEVGRLDEIGPQGGRMVLEFGTLPWPGGAAAFVVERDFEAGGTFRDGARVNLSQPGEALVLRAAWSRSEPFSKRELELLLAALDRE